MAKSVQRVEDENDSGTYLQGLIMLTLKGKSFSDNG